MAYRLAHQMIQANLESEQFAKGLANALAFIPANSVMPNVFLRLDPGRLVAEIVGTDRYAAGMATVPLISYSGPQEGAEILIPKGKAGTEVAEGAAGLERTVRIAGKGPCALTVTEVTAEVAPMGGDALRVDLAHHPDWHADYTALREYMYGAAVRPERIPGVVCIDPALLSRFSKVKPDKPSGRMADLLFGDDPLDPVLVKIGTDFVGLVMPIDRDVNAKNVGSDGLW